MSIPTNVPPFAQLSTELPSLPILSPAPKGITFPSLVITVCNLIEFSVDEHNAAIAGC